jgi:hypothetical protein
LLRVGLGIVLLAKLGNPTFCFPPVIIREPFEEQQREDVSLVILNLATQAGVRNAPEETA